MSEPPRYVLTPTVARTRPGGAGVLVQALGSWAEPFEITTRAEAANLTAAHDLFVNYRSLVGNNCVEVIWCGLTLSGYNHKFFVLHVEPAGAGSIRRLVNAVGTNGQYLAEATCRWRLQPATLLNN